MFLDLIDGIINCFETAINSVQESSRVEINQPNCKEDDEAEMLPLFDKEFNLDYLDEIPF